MTSLKIIGDTLDIQMVKDGDKMHFILTNETIINRIIKTFDIMGELKAFMKDEVYEVPDNTKQAWAISGILQDTLGTCIDTQVKRSYKCNDCGEYYTDSYDAYSCCMGVIKL